MKRDGETMAIIRYPKFGVGDRGTTRLRLSTYTGENTAAGQSFNPEEAAKILEAYGVDDVAKLNGKPCWVDTSNPGIMVWSRPLVFA
jgi:hypothetical protein